MESPETIAEHRWPGPYDAYVNWLRSYALAPSDANMENAIMTGPRVSTHGFLTFWRRMGSPAVVAGAGFALVVMVGCDTAQPAPDLKVLAIGADPVDADPNKGPLTLGTALLLGQTAMGLVRFDSRGQIVPGLAERWMLTADGLSLIFRLRRLAGPDGKPVTAELVAHALNLARGRNSRNPLKPYLEVIEQVSAMTDRVVEIRIRAPRPHLLELLAQPELAFRTRGAGRGAEGGVGPLVRAPAASSPSRSAISAARSRDERGWPLILVPADHEVDDDVASDQRDRRRYRLGFASASLALTSFRYDRSDVVTGGRWRDWPLVRAADIAAEEVRIDPAEGLFGLAVTAGSALASRPDLVQAMAMAIDRPALAQTLGVPGWRTCEAILPGPLDLAGQAPQPAWTGLDPARRRDNARRQFAQWRGAATPIRISLGEAPTPASPAYKLLLTRLTLDWGAIGLKLVLVPETASPDLILIDEVMPNHSSNWFLTRIACTGGLACHAGTQALIVGARRAPTLEARAEELAKAAAQAEGAPTFIALGAPIRWSVVRPAVTGWQGNAFAVHPLIDMGKTDSR